MSNTNDPNDKDREQTDDDTIKALHEFSDAEESEDLKELDEPEEGTADEELDATEGQEETETSEGTPSPAASGFVGMLAEQGKEGGLDASQSPPATANGGDSADKIHIAKEIGAVPSVVGGGVRTVRKGRPVPNWYHAAVPVMYTLGVMLILIGLWAIGALIFMAIKAPDDMGRAGYWLLSTTEDVVTGEYTYTKGSYLMAGVMLVSLPVALAMGMMAGIMQQQIRRAAPKPETKSE